jgi:hypothetical protein
MEEIKAPKKERKFLKAVGNIAKVLANELVMGIARKFIGKAIDKVGNKKQGLVIAFLLVAGISYASIDSIPYPVTGNKQRLGWQTTGNGLVYRGRATDTITKPTSYADKNVKAYLILDSVSGSLYVFKQGSWAAISGAGGGLTMPFDSITFNTAKDGTVGVGEVEYNDTQGSLIQGLKGGNVTNVIGQQLHQRVNNRTGSTLTKGTAVYLSGSQGNRITVAKALGVTDAFSANTFGIVAESIANNQSGYIITEGLITGINTSSLVEDSAVYLSPTVAGGLTSTKPQAPQHTVYIGVCVKSNAGSGELFVKIRNGQELDELHDVRITSPVNKASLYYLSSEGVWRDTTPTLLVSDTASMLANYATKAYADTSGRFYARQDFRNVSSSTLTWTQTDTLVVNDTTSLQVYRNGQILLPSQYTVPTKTSVVIGSTAYKLGENYTVIFPRGGGGGGSGSGSLTSISGGTGITVSPNPITTTGTVSADLSVLMELTDTSLLNLTTRFATKQNNITLTTTGTSGAATLTGATLNIPQYSGGGSGTVTSVGSGYGLLGGPITTSGTLRVDTSTVYDFVRDSIVAVEIGGDTIKIIKQEYENVTSDTLVFTILPKFPIQLRQFILLFRNGQLLLNDQFSVIDTNKVKVAATSFKVGENYTLVTVSGIGSVSSGQGNPIYPEAGIALSTGTTWTTSIVNNSSNWNTAYTDRLKWDGGSTDLVAATGRTSLGGTTIGQSMFTLTNPSAITFPRFNADNSVTALSAANFRTAIGAGTVTTVTAAAGTPISITNNTTTPELTINAASASVPGYLLSADWTTFNNKQAALDFTPANSTITIGTNAPLQGGGDLTANRTLSITQATSTANGFLTSTDWNTFNNKVNISDTSTMLSPYFRDADTSSLNLTTRFASKQNNLTLTTTGTSGAATLVGSTLNIPQYSGGGGGSGTVTSVGLTAPSIFNVGGSPVTTSGTLALTYSGTALPLLNGGTGATTADAALTNLGVTTVGKALLVADNSVSDKFIKVNANKTITLLTAADTRTAIGATTLGSNLFTLNGIGTIAFPQVNANNTVTLISDTQLKNVIGAGSVSSVAMTVPTFLSVSGSPITTTGTLAVSLSGVPLPVLNGGTGGANETDARNNLGAACKSCTETLTGTKTFSSDIIVNGINIGKGASSISSNTRVGIGALSSITTGVNNTAIGNGSGDLITTGESNTFLGSDAGFNITTGSYNTVIGHNSRPSANNSTLQLIVGHNLLGKGNSTAYIGGSSGVYNEKNVTTWETTSDIRLKKNIEFYYEGLNKINQIEVKNYEYKTKEEVIDSLKLSVIERKGIQIGVIAQEYQKIFPESVSTNSTGILSINTDNLIWHLVNSVKELSNELNNLKLEILNLKKEK